MTCLYNLNISQELSFAILSGGVGPASCSHSPQYHWPRHLHEASFLTSEGTIPLWLKLLALNEMQVQLHSLPEV